MMKPDLRQSGVSDALFHFWDGKHETYEMEYISEGYMSASSVEQSVLLVSFEQADAASSPFAASLADESGISFLTVLTDRDEWFRDDALFAYFDKLTDEGFFDNFEHIVFFGAGMCGYAAAAFSVVAPGSTVVVVSPQATLDPSVASWDKRFTDKRRLDFTSRYGYAPKMVEAAENVFVIFDPDKREEAAHAALFAGANVTLLKARLIENTPAEQLDKLGILTEIVDAACEKQLTGQVYHQLLRARRRSKPYAMALLSRLESAGRIGLASKLAAWASRRYDQTYFRDRLTDLQSGTR